MDARTHVHPIPMGVVKVEVVACAEAKRQKKLRQSSMHCRQHRRQGDGKYTSFRGLMVRDADALSVDLKALRIGISARTAGQEWKV